MEGLALAGACGASDALRAPSFPLARYFEEEVEEEKVVAPPAMPYVPPQFPPHIHLESPPVGQGGTVVSPSVVIADEQRLVTEQLEDESSMDRVQQSGGQQTVEQQTGQQQSGEK
ncbi:unnamed protein product [Closterium sp. Naga37s-1]|nr:unnamed protein product [Closterium sp. Naga37s-1]